MTQLTKEKLLQMVTKKESSFNDITNTDNLDHLDPNHRHIKQEEKVKRMDIFISNIATEIRVLTAQC